MMVGNPGRPAQSVPELIAELRRCIVFLGEQVGDKPRYSGTGFVVGAGGRNHILTAAHVVRSSPGTDSIRDLHVFLNRKNGTLGRRRVADYAPAAGIRWVFHPNPEMDLAAIQFPTDAADNLLQYPETLFTRSENLLPLLDIFYLSFQPGAGDEQIVSPVARVGVVSRINSDGTFMIDGAAFPGNSGSPVFVRPVPGRFGQGGLILGDPLALQFVGVIGSYIPYRDVAVSEQTMLPRVVFEENTGLSLVYPVDSVRQLFDRSKAP